MGTRMGKLAAMWVVATVVAVAVDVVLSALNGYFFRIDAGWLLLSEFAGIALGTAPAIVGTSIVLAILRRGKSPLPGAITYAAIIAPIALLLVWRHPGPIAFAVLGALVLDWVAFAWLEARGTLKFARPALVIFLIVASVGAVATSIALPLPGRDQIPAAPTTPAAEREGPNLIFVVLDTLRTDHMGMYGYERKTTPWLDEFASKATVYENLAGSSSYTLPTHATLFTGLLAETHGALELHNHDGAEGVSLEELGLQADFAKVAPLSDEAVTLAEVLSERGYETGAICANTAYLARAFNLDQGFATYVDETGSRAQWRPLGLSIMVRLPLPERWRLERLLGSNERYYLLAPEINALAKQWIEGRADRPFFLFLNYMEAHAPYLPLPGYRDLFPQSYAHQTADWARINAGEIALTADEKTVLVDAYDAEIKSLDDRLRDMFAYFEAEGALENTIVVFVGDHGESFGEHGKLGHALTVFQPEVHVPLIVKLPGQSEGKREPRFVNQADVMPTLLREMGAPIPDGIEGTDLTIAERKLPSVTYFGPYERDYTEYAVYSDPWKLIWSSNKPAQLYNVLEDAGEQNDQAAAHPEVVTELMALLDKHQTRPSIKLNAGPMVMDAETQERLEAVGYVGSDKDKEK